VRDERKPTDGSSLYHSLYQLNIIYNGSKSFSNRKKELVGKMEQPEYTKTPRGLVRQCECETPEAEVRRLKLSPTESEVYCCG